MHGSGEIMLAFSTANMVPRHTREMVYRMKSCSTAIGPLYEAVIDATEEAILNALCAPEDMDGVNGNVSKALAIADVKELVSAWQRQVEGRRTPASRGSASKRGDGGPAVE